jgi:hypothetical protein
MNRRLLAVMLCVFTAPVYSMTATVAPAAQEAGPPNSSGNPKANVATGDAASKANADAMQGKSMAPNATTLTRPAAVLSAPGVPSKSTAAPIEKSAAARPRPSAILPSTVPQAVPSPAGAAWSATARQSTGMHRGTLEAINAGAGTLQVFGQKLAFAPQRVKVFNRDGRPGSVYGLKGGANIRFTFDGADPSKRRVAVIYVE